MSGAATGAPAGPPPGAPPPIPFTARVAAGLLGVFIGAMMSGLNNRVGALALVDIRGAHGFSMDGASWLGTAYSAGELIAMPFATWFAITLSLKRFHQMMLTGVVVLAAIIPFADSLPLLIGLRAVQGVAGGALIPVLMMAALRFLPAPIRLHGFALYAMTATFAPNLAIWLTAQWTDQLIDWRLVYWQVIPLGLLALALVGWGMPASPPVFARFKTGNWYGMAFGVVGLALLAVAADQGDRLDWMHSRLIVWALASGLAACAVYLLSEWYHPAPFIKLSLLSRRNLALGFIIFILLLVTLLSGSSLPAGYLGAVQGYRAMQSAPIGLLIGLPQLVIGPLVALLLYQKWVDARVTLSLGLACIAYACLLGSQLTDGWIWQDFLWPQLLECLGQPLAIISMLYLATGVVQPMEGPYLSGAINMLRALGTLLGSSLISEFITKRGDFHSEMLLDSAARAGGSPAIAVDPGQLAGVVHIQGFILATADAYRVLGILAALLIPLALLMQFIPAPVLPAPAKPSASHG